MFSCEALFYFIFFKGLWLQLSHYPCPRLIYDHTAILKSYQVRSALLPQTF